MKKIFIYLLCFCFFSTVSFASTQYNITFEAQLLDSANNVLTGNQNVTVNLYNSSNNLVFSKFYSPILDAQGRFYDYINTSYTGNDSLYITFNINNDNETNKSLVGYVYKAINSQFLDGYDASYFTSYTDTQIASLSLSSNDTIWNISGSKYLDNYSGILDVNETSLNATINYSINKWVTLPFISSLISGAYATISSVNSWLSDINLTVSGKINNNTDINIGISNMSQACIGNVCINSWSAVNISGSGSGNESYFGTLTGAGSSGTIPLWNGTQSLNDSIIQQSNDRIKIPGEINITKNNFAMYTQGGSLYIEI